MKKFWAVSTKYFDSGRVKVSLYPSRGRDQAGERHD